MNEQEHRTQNKLTTLSDITRPLNAPFGSFSQKLIHYETYNNAEKNKILKTEEFIDRIICGDALKVMGKMPSNSVHLAVTSPPYNVGKQYDNHFDGMEHEKYLEWLKNVWVQTKRVLVSGGRFALNIAPTGIKNFNPIHHDFAYQLREIGMAFRTEILWYKGIKPKKALGSLKSPRNPHIVPSWEYVLIFSKYPHKLEGNPQDADITSDEFIKFSDGFWQIEPETERRGHPAPFPEELVHRLVKFYTYKGNTVLDVFGGSGTTAVVCYKTGRRFTHIDISEKYCDIAKNRLEQAKLMR